MLLIDEIYQSFKNKTRPGIKWKMVGDMWSRMDFIQETFVGVQTITEFGPFQGCSTAAWLKLNPKKFTTVDQGIALEIDLFKAAAEEIGVEFNFIVNSDLNIIIEPCELLFIDTVHTEDHTFKELELHADKVTRYLVFHDIVESRFGTLAGIKKWWKNHPEWIEKYSDHNDCGFLVLEKINE
jgi:hypothetical protein